MHASWKMLGYSLTCQRYRSSHVFLRNETSVFNGSVHWGNVVEGRSSDLAYRLFWSDSSLARCADEQNSLWRICRRVDRASREEVVAKARTPLKSIGLCRCSVTKQSISAHRCLLWQGRFSLFRPSMVQIACTHSKSQSSTSVHYCIFTAFQHYAASTQGFPNNRID